MTINNEESMRTLIDEIEKGNILTVMHAQRFYTDYALWMEVTLGKFTPWNELTDKEKKAWLMASHAIPFFSTTTDDDIKTVVGTGAPIITPEMIEETEKFIDAELLLPSSPIENKRLVIELQREVEELKERLKFFEGEFADANPDAYNQAKDVYDYSTFKHHHCYVF